MLILNERVGKLSAGAVNYAFTSSKATPVPSNPLSRSLLLVIISLKNIYSDIFNQLAPKFTDPENQEKKKCRKFSEQ